MGAGVPAQRATLVSLCYRQRAGGSALTGVGGDQIFLAGQTLRLARMLTFEQRPRLRDWRTFAGAVTPRSIRRRRWKKGLTTLPWLTEAANRRLSETQSSDLAIDPIWFASTVRGPIWRERSRVAADRTLRALCADIDTSMAHPLEDPGFLSALASALPRTGYRTRDEAMTALVRAPATGNAAPTPYQGRFQRRLLQRPQPGVRRDLGRYGPRPRSCRGRAASGKPGSAKASTLAR